MEAKTNMVSVSPNPTSRSSIDEPDSMNNPCKLEWKISSDELLFSPRQSNQQRDGDCDPGRGSGLAIAFERWNTKREDGREKDIEARNEAHFGRRRRRNAPAEKGQEDIIK